MQLFLAFTQFILNFESSFAGIREVLRVIWLFEHKFQARKFGQLWIFGSIKFVNNLFIKLINFILISDLNRNRKVEITNLASNQFKDLRRTLKQ